MRPAYKDMLLFVYKTDVVLEVLAVFFFHRAYDGCVSAKLQLPQNTLDLNGIVFVHARSSTEIHGYGFVLQRIRVIHTHGNERLYIPIIAERIRSEERILKEGLRGYSEYMEKVKYRLIPFLW